MRTLAFALALTLLGAPAYAEPRNPSCTWGCSYQNSSATDRYIHNTEALTDLGLRRRGAGLDNGSGSNAGTTNNFNGTVNNTYTGPMSSSGSSVVNIQNANDTRTDITATGGSTVDAKTTTGQTAIGGTQSGAANANAAVGNNAQQSGKQSATSN